MILPKVILESQDILVSSPEGPQEGFFSFSSGGYLAGGAVLTLVYKNQVDGVIKTQFCKENIL